jgi:hypothetical protein
MPLKETVSARNRGKKSRSETVDIGGHIGELHLLSQAGSPSELRIDSEGRWFHGGVEIVRKDIVQLFASNLRRAKAGGYLLVIGRDEAPVIVEDAPFVVLRVERKDERFQLLLSDGSTELLRPETVTFRDNHIPYCLVRGACEAKFSRQAYYQLARHIEYDESDGAFSIMDGDKRIKLKVRMKE